MALFVQGVRVDESAVAGLWLRTIVEYPDNLGWELAFAVTETFHLLTVIMESRM